MAQEDRIPATGAMLDFINMLYHAREMYISQACLADELGLDKRPDWYALCEELFSKQFAKEAVMIGFALNKQTFEAIMRIRIPEEMMMTPSSDLPVLFAFDPWLGMGYGGFVRVTT